MLEVTVDLHFSCCQCAQGVSVTVKCRGKGLAAGPRTVTTVAVPCPACYTVNQLYFEPSGVVRAVTLQDGRQSLPQPSVN